MLTLEDYEKLNPICEVAHEAMSVRYLTPSTQLKWRVDTLFTKEPSTIEWIAGFRRGEVLVEEIIAAFAERYDVSVDTVSAAEEAVFFPLPRALREPQAAE